ncbi:MAG TPA: hypothetical protein VJJ47_00420 [Candidatus Paceibacterota bacterium]
MIPCHRLVAGSVFTNRVLPRDIISSASDWGLGSFETREAAFAAHCIVKAAQRCGTWLGHRGCLGFLRWELRKICEAEGRKPETLETGLRELERQNFIEQTGRRDDDHVRLSKYFAGSCNTAKLPPGAEIEGF